MGRKQPQLVVPPGSGRFTYWSAGRLVSLQPLSVLVREYFVPICALCIAVHCSMRPNKEIGGMALNNLILQFANISELERDELIKKHMGLREAVMGYPPIAHVNKRLREAVGGG
ncbi:hypothetical protein GW17_00007838 [Ensete ventricosum]|nr:hypothetical protein GW17_00007838 [Ensete ventricosum]